MVITPRLHPTYFYFAFFYYAESTSLLESHQTWTRLGDSNDREVFDGWMMDGQICKWIRWIQGCVGKRSAMQVWTHGLLNERVNAHTNAQGDGRRSY